MAIELSTLPIIYPAYSDNLILNVSETGATNTHYYRFDVYINSGLTDTFNYPADPIYLDATINLSTILSTYFESVVYIPSSIDLIEEVTDSVVPYNIIVSLYTSGDTFVTSADTGTYYTFNGCTNMEEVFDVTDYLMNSGNSGNFLTNWHTDREITINDYAHIQVLHGDYTTGYTSTFGGIKITKYNYDGSTSAITETYTGTTKCIVNIDVSPISINTVSIGFIDDNVDYYTIEEISGYTTTPMKIKIIKENKLTKYYNFIYVNKIGGTDFFTAVKVSEDKYDIKKNLLEQYVDRKVYYTDVERTTTVVTQFLSAYQAAKLKELFSSSAVKLWFGDKMNSVQVKNKDIIVFDRYPKDKFIQYEIEFRYNYRYHTQQF